jgi:hypothetical protein
MGKVEKVHILILMLFYKHNLKISRNSLINLLIILNKQILALILIVIAN